MMRGVTLFACAARSLLQSFAVVAIRLTSNEPPLPRRGVIAQRNNLPSTINKTLGFTFLNPHVYSDTVFFLGNFSKSLSQMDKYYFGAGAAISSFLFFFILGYLSKYFSKYLKSVKVWKRINYLIILFMSILALTVLMEII